jgi:MoaA/NifB/PqqE/SkfB family radical SAM enzyme
MSDRECMPVSQATTEHEGFVSFTLEFRCNLRCSYCMIEDLMDHLIPENMQRFEELLAYNARTASWQGIILTGAEITLRADLPELAAKAKAAGFEHVRIQSHGMRLAQVSYCERLIDAGVDQFFISMPAADTATHDAITGVPGSRAKTLQGLANLEVYPHVAVITNTVVTSQNYQSLPEVVEALAHLKRLVRMEFWNYWPMQEADSKGLVARHTEVLPYLLAAIELAQSYGRDIEIKNFPPCLLGGYGHLVVNRQPQLFIDPAFWTEFARNGFYQCVYRERCANTECLGLNEAYITKFGDESDVLSPISGKPG